MVRFTRGLVRYRPLLFLVNLLAWSVSHMAPLLPGYLTKVYYDGLAGDAPLTITPLSILVLLAARDHARAVRRGRTMAVGRPVDAGDRAGAAQSAAPDRRGTGRPGHPSQLQRSAGYATTSRKDAPRSRN